MRQPALTRLRGMVVIEVTGGQVESFVNLLSKRQIPVWDVRPLNGNRAEMKLLLPDVFSLRPLLRRTGCRMHVTRRTGFPFIAARLGRRKFFAAGLLLFFVAIYMMSSLIWTVEVKGNESLTTEEVLRAAREEGIYPLQWSFRLAGQDKLSKDLMRKLPDASWIGVEKQGTVITIQVVEASRAAPKPLLDPRHLISKADAVITEIYAEQGRPVVQKNTRVKRGDILISGTLGDEENQEQVVAKGQVRGLVWHEYEISTPLVQRSKTYTGESRERLYLVLGNRAVQFWGYGKDPYAAADTVTEYDPLTWRSVKLPFGWMTERVMETQEQQHAVSEQAAKELGLTRARTHILAKYGKGTKILGQKILHEKKENGKVYMKVLFEVEQEIAEELPLVYNRGD
ncbi:sporulation protein YqfD [Paenibacillus sp. P96]|uniref:Sporulation protein YqfD n=1 Tax=Paenibacillus zeirhizosphaerae TaxID=2987519 RepID=A0ABT9FQI5_9BACL|nr:sporulation protein YqfD [Paenibacillus sp. P96]MDP4096985.1 sporulation protein YqfD [Paenibacillus sp. P96]